MGKVAQGEYVDPETLEEVYSKSNYIAQVQFRKNPFLHIPNKITPKVTTLPRSSQTNYFSILYIDFLG